MARKTFLQPGTVGCRCTEMNRTTNATTAYRNNCYPIHLVYAPQETQILRHSRGDHSVLALASEVMLVGYDGTKTVVASAMSEEAAS